MPLRAQPNRRRAKAVPRAARTRAARVRASRARTARLRSRRPDSRAYASQARTRLQRFRQGSTLAVALTALLLLVGGVVDDATGQPPEPAAVESAEMDTVADPTVALEQAGTTVRELLLGFYGFLPKLALCLIVLGFAWLVSRLVGMALRAVLGQWERTAAVSALASIAVYLGAIAVSMSILAGDARALLGSVGLVGLALSWALQTPIESFTGWFLNSLRGYYRVGDRIEVGDVFGDVYRIDVLTTTVWEAGGPGKAVAGAQPTGAMITFPNWEVLRSNIVNYTRDFPYVWDEVTVSVANESDLAYTAQVFRDIAREVIGPEMGAPAEQYQALLHRARIGFDIPEDPSLFFSNGESWTNCTVRYLVGARQRRRRASDLLVALSNATLDPRHAGKILSSYPRSEVRLRRAWEPIEYTEKDSLRD